VFFFQTSFFLFFLLNSSLIILSICAGVTATTFTRANEVLNEKLDVLTVRVNAIYFSVCPSAIASAKETEEGLPTLPLDSMEELDNFEKFISVEAHRLSVVSIVFLFGFCPVA